MSSCHIRSFSPPVLYEYYSCYSFFILSSSVFFFFTMFSSVCLFLFCKWLPQRSCGLGLSEPVHRLCVIVIYDLIHNPIKPALPGFVAVGHVVAHTEHIGAVNVWVTPSTSTHINTSDRATSHDTFAWSPGSLQVHARLIKDVRLFFCFFSSRFMLLITVAHCRVPEPPPLLLLLRVL